LEIEDEFHFDEVAGEFAQAALKGVQIVVNEQEDLTCPMCLNDIKVGEECIKLPCLPTPHYFHKVDADAPPPDPDNDEDEEQCVPGGVMNWLAERNATCPVCRFHHEGAFCLFISISAELCWRISHSCYLSIGGATLTILLFHASWCRFSKQVSPVFRLSAMNTPIARFLRVDIDDCDQIVERFNVAILPTVVFLRGGTDVEHECAPRVETGGPQFSAAFGYSLKQACNDKEQDIIRLYNSDEVETMDDEALTSAADEVCQFSCNFCYVKINERVFLDSAFSGGSFRPCNSPYEATGTLRGKAES